MKPEPPRFLLIGFGAVGQGLVPLMVQALGIAPTRITAAGSFRLMYVAKFANAVHAHHCFQKKKAKTSKADLDLGAKRYRDLAKELGQ